MGLSFLNQKSVHTGSFGNIAKVWKAESDFQDRIKLIKEREKKLKEERQIEEIKKLKVEAGLMSQTELDKVDFIYKEDTGINKNNNINDFFDNNYKKKENEKKPKISATVNQSEIISNPKNELFTRIHEDPLYLIKKEEIKRKQEVEENPYKLKSILKEIEKELLDEEKKYDKKKDKERKKQKKKEKEERRERKEHERRKRHDKETKVEVSDRRGEHRSIADHNNCNNISNGYNSNTDLKLNENISHYNKSHNNEDHHKRRDNSKEYGCENKEKVQYGLIGGYKIKK